MAPGKSKSIFLATALAAAAAAVLVGLPLRERALDLRAGPNVLVNPPRPIDASNSPTLLRNPRLSSNLVVSHRVDRPQFNAYVQSSFDEGATWHETVLPLPSGLDRPFAPDLAFAPDGTLFASYVNLQGNGNVPDNVWLSSSKDGGRTFSEPVRVGGKLAFQVRIAIDPKGRIHLTWLQAAAVGLFKLVGGPNPIVAVTSTDGGLTFSDPVTVSDPDRSRVGAATPVIDSDGALVVLYEDFEGDRRDFEYLEGPPWQEPFTLVVTRSSDGGQTFSEGVEVDRQVLPGRRFLVFLPEFPSIAAGRDNSLYVSWSDARNGDEDVFLRRSGDGGRTWGELRRVNDRRREDGTTQSMPRVAVAPDGRVDVLYLDRRADGADRRIHATLASSDDEGATYTTARVASEPSDALVGPEIADEFPIDFGSRLGLVSTDDGAIAAWTDTRKGTEDTGRQDIAAAGITIAEEPLSRARLTATTAFAALGLLALAAWAFARRRDARSAPVPQNS